MSRFDESHLCSRLVRNGGLGARDFGADLLGLYELWSKLLKEGYLGDYIGNYYRDY